MTTNPPSPDPDIVPGTSRPIPVDPAEPEPVAEPGAPGLPGERSGT